MGLLDGAYWPCPLTHLHGFSWLFWSLIHSPLSQMGGYVLHEEQGLWVFGDFSGH